MDFVENCKWLSQKNARPPFSENKNKDEPMGIAFSEILNYHIPGFLILYCQYYWQSFIPYLFNFGD